MEAQLIVPARTARRPIGGSLVGDERLARLVAGDAGERAFAALYERYHQPLYRYCRSIVGNDADAQDALQSAFAAAFAALRRGQRDAPVRPWLFRIAHNESVSALRRRRPQEELLERYEGYTVSVEERAEERARLAMLVADLRELPDRQRAALVMRELSGLSHEEIAIALGTTLGAAKQTICEARRSLLELSEGRAMGCEEVRCTISDADGRALRSRRVRAHLRDCAGCAAFAAAIPARRADLRALVPPLPALTAAGLFARALLGGSGHGGGGARGVAAGAAGKTVGATLAAKTLAGVAIVVTATAGVATVLRHPAHPVHPVLTTHQPPATRRASTRQTPRAARGTTLASYARAGRAAPKAGRHGAVGVRAGPAAAAPRARFAGQAPLAAASRGIVGSGMTGSGGNVRPVRSSHPRSASTRRLPHTPSGSGGSRGADRRSGAPTSVSATRTQRTLTAGRSSTRSAVPAGSTGGSPGEATGSRPGPSPLPAATSLNGPPVLPSGSAHPRSGAR